MLVVAFSGLVIVAQHAHLIDHQRQAIFEVVKAARGRLSIFRGDTSGTDHDVLRRLPIAEGKPTERELNDTERAATAECVNAQVCERGLTRVRVRVRGTLKVRFESAGDGTGDRRRFRVGLERTARRLGRHRSRAVGNRASAVAYATYYASSMGSSLLVPAVSAGA
jgi:hypothetical protein